MSDLAPPPSTVSSQPAAPPPAPDLDPRTARSFGKARRAAVRVIHRRSRATRIASAALPKLAKNSETFSEVRREFGLLIRMVRAWSKREYTSVPWRVLVYAVAALIYFVNPVDLVPDVLVGIGFVDDLAVVGAVIKSIQGALEQFETWERGHAEVAETGPDVGTV
jgi:uncharacterized membrane protein YkvA (DUF1232 family)